MSFIACGPLATSDTKLGHLILGDSYKCDVAQNVFCYIWNSATTKILQSASKKKRINRGKVRWERVRARETKNKVMWEQNL